MVVFLYDNSDLEVIHRHRPATNALLAAAMTI